VFLHAVIGLERINVVTCGSLENGVKMLVDHDINGSLTQCLQCSTVARVVGAEVEDHREVNSLRFACGAGVLRTFFSPFLVEATGAWDV